jgi:hypothetical protein
MQSMSEQLLEEIKKEVDEIVRCIKGYNSTPGLMTKMAL